MQESAIVIPASKLLNVSIQRDTDISIHQQLVTQISLQIASGQLPEGTKLPSVRGLSQKLHIHYNTCLGVYKKLAKEGLVEARKGHGMVVNQFKLRESLPLIAEQPLEQLVKQFAEMVQEQGYTLKDLESALKITWQQKNVPQRIVFADIHDDILPVFKAELEEILLQPVHTINLNQWEAQEKEYNTCYIVSRYHYHTLKKRLVHDDDIVVIDIAAAQQEIEWLKALPEGALITIISTSRSVLQMAESIISSFRGTDILFFSLLYDDKPEELKLSIQHAQVVVCDFLCNKVLQQNVQKEIRVLRLIPESEIQKIKQKIT